MGDMADWAFDQALEQEAASLCFFGDLSTEELMEEVEELLTSPSYKHNSYTGMVVDIYMAHLSGFDLTARQRHAVSMHLIHNTQGTTL